MFAKEQYNNSTITPETYAALFEAGTRPQTLLGGVCGRIIRGREEKDFEKLSFLADRRFAFIVGPDGLSEMIGKSGAEIVLSIGKSPTWLSDQLQAGMKWKLVVFPQDACVTADWKGLFSMIDRYYPEVIVKLGRWTNEVRDPKLAMAVSRDLVRSEVKDNLLHPEHMSVSRYLDAEDTPLHARLFLWHTLGVNELFTGTGLTQPPGQAIGQSEYLVPNLPLAIIPDCKVIDLNVY